MLKNAMSLLLCGGIMLTFTSEAHAYIDPGTGSYIIQILFGLFLGFSLLIKSYWRNIVIFAKRMFSHDKNSEKNDE